MKTQLITLSLLLLGLTAGAQQPYLSREAYRDKVEAYSQILKQQKLKTMARSLGFMWLLFVEILNAFFKGDRTTAPHGGYG